MKKDVLRSLGNIYNIGAGYVIMSLDVEVWIGAVIWESRIRYAGRELGITPLIKEVATRIIQVH
jgi:hypothetical protein